MIDLSMDERNSQSSFFTNDGSHKGRLLALDIGDKRIGMAISDPLGITAQGLPTLSRRGKKYDIKYIIDVIAQYHVIKIVYGLPKNMNGSLGSQAEKTEYFIKQLKSRTDCLFIPWDERLTTRSAHNALKESGMSRKKRSQKVDMLSALLILQNYLDLNCNSGDMR